MRRVLLRFIKDPLLRKLVVGTNSLRQAKNELRWMKQELPQPQLKHAVDLRGKYSYPLQYILGTQPFGALDIKCAPGVLIPRWETEEWVSDLANVLKSEPEQPKILDLCTGTGCVLFGLCDLLPNATGVAADINPKAIELFLQNQQSAAGMLERTKVYAHDLFTPLPKELRSVNCVVANPPYISDLTEADYGVRKHEPKEALLEPPRLWEELIARVVETEAVLAVFEVGYRSQINHCANIFATYGWECQGKRDSNGNWRTVWATKNKE